MLGLSTRFPPTIRFLPSSTAIVLSKSKLRQRGHLGFRFVFLKLKSHAQILKQQTPTRLAAQANDKGLRKDEEDREEDDGKSGSWILSGIRWGDLLLDPDPDNILAVGLTGLLTWASAQVLWQLLFISLAILVAAVKYSLIAALLIFILITLL